MELSEDKWLRLPDGKVVKSLYMLPVVLENVEEQEIPLITSWVESLGEKALAEDLEKCKDPDEMVSVVKEFLSQEEDEQSEYVLISGRKPGLKERVFSLIRRLALRLRREKKLVLEDTFKASLQEYRQRIQDMEKLGYSCTGCHSYFAMIEDRIKIYQKTREEKDAISVLHLFYCIDDELKEMKGEILNSEEG